MISSSAVITLPFSGLELANISARFYREGVRVVAEESAISLTEITDSGPSHTYLIKGPSANGQPCALTWWVSGQGGALEYGFDGTPSFVVLPVRMAGVSVASLSLRLFRDTVEITDDVTFTVDEVGDTLNLTPDLIVDGWTSLPLPESGSHYLLLYTLSGTTYQRSWQARNTTGSITGTLYSILEITASQRPLSIGLDDNSPRRDIWAVNFLAQGVSPIDKWDVAMAYLLENLGLGVYVNNTTRDIFVSRNASIPAGTTALGPYTFLADTGGTSPIESHDASKIERLGLQITVRASSTTVARARINQVYSALDGLRDITITVP